MVDRLGRLVQWLTHGAARWALWSTRLLAMPENTISEMSPPSEGVGQRGQSYGIGSFACGLAQAVVVEIPVPACRYWSVSLVNRFWETVDCATCQTSLNDCQGVPDNDGVVRAVISHEDPDVANWLDPGGETEGTIFMHYLYPDTVPSPTLRQVRLSELLRSLPDGTESHGRGTTSNSDRPPACCLAPLPPISRSVSYTPLHHKPNLDTPPNSSNDQA